MSSAVPLVAESAVPSNQDPLSKLFAGTDTLEFRESDRPDGETLSPFSLRYRTWEDARKDRERLEDALASARSLDLLRVHQGAEGEGHVLRLGPAGRCGFCTVRIEGEPLFIHVTPKIDGADHIGLMMLAGDLPSLALQTADLRQDRTGSLLLFMLVAFSQALHQLLFEAGGLRRLHETRGELLRGRIRGRVTVGRYLREIAGGRAMSIPCSYPSHQLDNLPNRALRWALELLLGACWSVPFPKHHGIDLKGQLASFRGLFGGVPLSPVRHDELDRLVRLPGAFDAYESSRALPLARWIIRNFSLDSQAGGVPSVGFSYNLAGVFERALARAVAQRLGVPMGSIAQRSWTFTAEGNQLDTKEGTCRPDLYITADGQLRPLVADTKWKAAMAQGEEDQAEDEESGGVGADAFTSSALRVDGIKLINTDIYQILSYAYLASRDKANKAVRGEAIPGALVYPVKNKAKDDRLRIKLVERDQDLELYLIPWVVGDGQLQKRTEEVVTLLLELREQRGT